MGQTFTYTLLLFKDFAFNICLIGVVVYLQTSLWLLFLSGLGQGHLPSLTALKAIMM